MGFGRGWRHWYYATGLPGWARASAGMPAWGVPGWAPGLWPGYAPTPEQELGALKSQAEYFEKGLEEIRKRISELEKSKSQ